MKYRKKPIVVEAVQWFKNGDHPEDDSFHNHGELSSETEGLVVRYYRHPNYRNPNRDGSVICKHCEHAMYDHGWIDTLEGGYIVCPGDFVVTGIKTERYPCKPDIFLASYEEVQGD